jgi:S1-C subfamily serine protease
VLKAKSEVIEMSVDTPKPEAEKQTRTIELRREALLPSERGRGLGTVAVVCTMAGVASGLALATTLMAMQVADSMAVRPSIHFVTTTGEIHSDRGYLGVHFKCTDSVCQIHDVVPNTPAEVIGLHGGDRVITINGDAIATDRQMLHHVAGSSPGTELVLVIERDGVELTLHPILTALPVRPS